MLLSGDAIQQVHRQLISKGRSTKLPSGFCLADWSIENECVVDKLRGGEPSCVRHYLGRINALTYRRDDRRTGRGCPYSKADCDHSGGNRTQTDRAHPTASSCCREFKPLVRYARPCPRPM